MSTLQFNNKATGSPKRSFQGAHHNFQGVTTAQTLLVGEFFLAIPGIYQGRLHLIQYISRIASHHTTRFQFAKETLSTIVLGRIGTVPQTVSETEQEELSPNQIVHHNLGISDL